MSAVLSLSIHYTNIQRWESVWRWFRLTNPILGISGAIRVIQGERPIAIGRSYGYKTSCATVQWQTRIRSKQCKKMFLIMKLLRHQLKMISSICYSSSALSGTKLNKIGYQLLWNFLVLWFLKPLNLGFDQKRNGLFPVHWVSYSITTRCRSQTQAPCQPL